MIREEFSFPIISSNNGVHLTVSRPLWRISSINQSDADQLELQVNAAGRNIINKRKVIFRSFSEVEGEEVLINKENNNNIINLEKAKAEAEAQEKLDMLWEDFNDEAASVENTTDSDAHEIFNDRTTNNDFRYFPGLEFEDDQPNNITVHESERPRGKRKEQLEIVGKMMKKLFLLHNMARIKKRSGPTSH